MARGLLGQLKAQALSLSNKAIESVLENPDRAMKVAAVAGAAQRGKARLDEAQGEALHAIGFAHRGDYKELEKRIGALRRKAKQLGDKVDKLARG